MQTLRAKLIEEFGAQRAIVQTACEYRNRIETVFVDQRTKSHNNGKYLVICFGGSTTFYEIGIFQQPIRSGYSALAWNYPSFGQSTGKPYPQQILTAADAVMQYAFSLGFHAHNIIFYSCSIGGFAASWLANNYPHVKAIVFDSYFDAVRTETVPLYACILICFTRIQ